MTNPLGTNSEGDRVWDTTMPHQVRYVEIFETYKKIGDEIYHIWRFPWDKEWRSEVTPFNELPWVEVDFSNQVTEGVQE